jgi:hypothetical protein
LKRDKPSVDYAKELDTPQ